MKLKRKVSVFAVSSLLASATLVVSVVTSMGNGSAKAQQTTRFSCENIQGIPTTVVKTTGGEKKFISWDSTYFVPSGYTPYIRCKQVTARLNNYFIEESQQHIATDQINSQPVICITFGLGKPCKSLLYTLKPGQNGEAAIDLLIRQTQSNFNEPPLREGSCHTYLSLNALIQGKPKAEKVCS